VERATLAGVGVVRGVESQYLAVVLAAIVAQVFAGGPADGIRNGM